MSTKKSTTRAKDKPLLGITMGDPAGIGPEVIAKALAGTSLQRLCRPIVIGSFPVMQQTGPDTKWMLHEHLASLVRRLSWLRAMELQDSAVLPPLDPTEKLCEGSHASQRGQQATSQDSTFEGIAILTTNFGTSIDRCR